MVESVLKNGKVQTANIGVWLVRGSSKMKFKSKTALIEHIKELVKDGYLTEHWHFFDIDDKHTNGEKLFKINFDAVKKK